MSNTGSCASQREVIGRRLSGKHEAPQGHEGTLATWISGEQEASRAGLDLDERAELARLRKGAPRAADRA
ncbi:hypothetical protein AB8O64_35795 (plasmid) [Streptomyces sp. QH1-20]|uniref:hypothetical protein n=1 Tax=Streptomyces sp. QH1-20 TaxID=3240934 RepID=UPI0035140ECB